MPSILGVRRMLHRGGMKGIRDIFSCSAKEEICFPCSVLILTNSYAAPSCFPSVVYDFNLETFAGHLVELTALQYLNIDLVRSKLYCTWRYFNRLGIKRELLDILSRPRWWAAHCEQLMHDILQALEDDRDAPDEAHQKWYYAWSQHGPPNFCELLAKALSKQSIYFKLCNPESVQQFIVFCRSIDWRSSPAAVFREHEPFWDNPRNENFICARTKALRHIHAFVHGGEMTNEERHDAMVYGTLLLYASKGNASRDGSFAATSTLLESMLLCSSLVKHLRLTADFESALREDAAQVCALHGSAMDMNVSLEMEYEYTADQEDRQVSSAGRLSGVCDALLLDSSKEVSLLEIKATREISPDCAAQALVYADMCKHSVDKVLLWDTRGRRLTTWTIRRDQCRELTRRCLQRHLEHNSCRAHSVHVNFPMPHIKKIPGCNGDIFIPPE